MRITDAGGGRWRAEACGPSARCSRTTPHLRGDGRRGPYATLMQSNGRWCHDPPMDRPRPCVLVKMMCCSKTNPSVFVEGFSLRGQYPPIRIGAIRPEEWPAAGSADTELRCHDGTGGDHGEAEVYTWPQATGANPGGSKGPWAAWGAQDRGAVRGECLDRAADRPKSDGTWQKCHSDRNSDLGRLFLGLSKSSR